MKRSLLIILSLILSCVMIFTACDNEINVSPQAPDSAESSENNSADTDYTLDPGFDEGAQDDNSLEAETPIPDTNDGTSGDDSNVNSGGGSDTNSGDNSDTNSGGNSDTNSGDNSDTNSGDNSDTNSGDNSDTNSGDSSGTNSGDSSGTTVLQDTMPASKSYAGVMHYTATNGDAKTCNVDFTVDFRTLIDGDNEVYSKELSKLSILCASDIYIGLYIQLTSGASGGNDDPTTFGKLLGLQDVKCYKIDGNNYTVDKDDVTEFVVGHKKVIYKGEAQEIIIVAVRGTNETNAEWSSNFDVGADTAEYYAATGSSHPDWKNKLNHKGFDVAANRVYDKLTAYINTYIDQSAKKSILLTGHSRGAGISNILGQMYEDKTDYRTYAYTFAAPNSTTASNAGSYKNIFNIINEDDIIPYLPLSQWGFTNYGVTRSVSVREYYGTGLLETAKENSFKWFIGESYNDDGGRQRTLNCFAALATCREDLYKLDPDKDAKINISSHLTLDGAESAKASLEAELQSRKLLKYCVVYIVDDLIGWHVEINHTPAYFMQVLSNLTTGDTDELLGEKLSGKYNDAKLSFIASSGKVLVGGMEHPHMQATYYLIARNDFATLV